MPDAIIVEGVTLTGLAHGEAIKFVLLIVYDDDFAALRAPQRPNRCVAIYFSPSLCKPGGLVSQGRCGVAVKRIRCRFTRYFVPSCESGR